MKHFIAMLILLGLFTGCKKDSPTPIEPQEVQFGIVNRTLSEGGRLADSPEPDQIQLTIETADGTLVLENEVVNLISFGESFVSEPVRLVPGDYRVTSFFVLDDSGTAIFAAPLENSELAQLVNDPLPIDFNVTRDVVTNVEVEVIEIRDTAPSEFGYGSFIPVFVPTFQFEIVVFESVEADGGIETTSADLTISSGSITLSYMLSAGVNRLTTRDSLTTYTLEVIKSGFETYTEVFTLPELRGFGVGNPLEIILSPEEENSSSVSFVLNQTLSSLTNLVEGVALGDIDGDGDLDAVLVARFNDNTIWFNDGSGFFTESSQRLPGTQETDVALGDFDGDNDLDIFITNGQNRGSNIYFNDGTGFFQDSGVDLGVGIHTDLTLGDVDGDGDLDALVTSQFGNNFVWIGNGAGVFQSPASIQVRVDPSSSTVFDGDFADFDGDGDLDVVVAGTNIDGFVFLNNGTIVWDRQTDPIITNGIEVLTADFDGDGDQDIVSLNAGLLINRVYFNDGLANFTISTFPSSVSYDNAFAADIDNDGDIDIVTAGGISAGPAANSILINDGNGGFTEGPFIQDPSVTGSDVEVADLNGDGIPDIFYGNSGSPSAIYFGQP